MPWKPRHYNIGHNYYKFKDVDSRSINGDVVLKHGGYIRSVEASIVRPYCIQSAGAVLEMGRIKVCPLTPVRILKQVRCV